MDEVYLSDEQYLDLLKRARAHLDEIKKAKYENSDMPGDKFVVSNVGLCNDDLSTKETSLFPDSFPKRKHMKYRRKNHKCPLDARSKPGVNGCFHTCKMFQNGMKDLEKIKKLYDEQIAKMEKKCQIFQES